MREPTRRDRVCAPDLSDLAPPCSSRARQSPRIGRRLRQRQLSLLPSGAHRIGRHEHGLRPDSQSTNLLCAHAQKLRAALLHGKTARPQPRQSCRRHLQSSRLCCPIPCSPERLSIGPLGALHFPKCFRGDHQIEPDGPVVYIKHVHLNFFFVRCGLAAHHLPETSKARLHGEKFRKKVAVAIARGPTKVSCPVSKLKNCGNSSRL